MAKSNLKSAWLAAALVLTFGLILTYDLEQMALESESRLQKELFSFESKEIRDSVIRRLSAYDEVLHGTRGLFRASEEVSRAEFKHYVDALSLGRHYPGIQGVGYSIIVPPSGMAQHIESIRKEGLPNYTPHPQGRRSLYTSIIYLEPFDKRNQQAFGFDMYSESVRRAAMDRARDINESAMSGKVTLVQEIDQRIQAGFLIYLPIYRNGSPRQTLAQRRANIIGWVYAPFRMNDLMAGILGHQETEVALRIFDGKNMAKKSLMYSSDNNLSEQSLGIYQRIERIEVAGHVWTIQIISLPAFDRMLNRGGAYVRLISGSLISLLLSLLIWQLMSGRARAFRLARGMTEELRNSESVLKQAESIAGLGSYVLDGQTYMWKSSKILDGIFGIDQSYDHSVDGWLRLIHPEDRAMMDDHFKTHVLADKQPFDKEYRIIRLSDGAERWLHGMGELEFDAKGNLLFMRGAILDITEQVKARQALAERADHMLTSLKTTLAAFSKSVEARDPYTAGHQVKVADLASAIAEEMGLDVDRVQGVRMGAAIHDIGKIHLPADLLAKPSKLSDIEFQFVETHTQVGYDILKDIESPWPIAEIALQHHERIDGSGYPQGLKGGQICLEARIVAVADVVEAMTSHRPFRPALGIEAALDEIRQGHGTVYDADVVDACLKLFKENRFSF
ncbi:MAG TPA: CHASE domain-containing protein [Mariprofundaceae bacterium]|nr:CHASE domain-containing protein [Mariprofundaceae bacterium]